MKQLKNFGNRFLNDLHNTNLRNYLILSSSGILWGIMGIFLIMMGAIKKEIIDIVRGGALVGLGVAYATSGIERILESNLDAIHRMLGPYPIRKVDKIVVLGSIFGLLAVFAMISSTVIQVSFFVNKYPLELFDFGIVLLTLSYVFFSLSKMHLTNNKYKDIHDNLVVLVSDMDKISSRLDAIIKKVKQSKKRKIKKKRIDRKNKVNTLTNDKKTG